MEKKAIRSAIGVKDFNHVSMCSTGFAPSIPLGSPNTQMLHRQDGLQRCLMCPGGWLQVSYDLLSVFHFVGQFEMVIPDEVNVYR